MDEFIIVGNSLLEKKILDFINDEKEPRKSNQISALFLEAQDSRFTFNNESMECLNVLIPKCVLLEAIEIPVFQNSVKEVNIEIFSVGELFAKSCRFLQSEPRVVQLDDLLIILLTGFYHSKKIRYFSPILFHLLIKCIPQEHKANNYLKLEIFRQVYEDIFNIISSLPNSTFSEMEFHEISQLNFAGMRTKQTNYHFSYISNKQSNVNSSFNVQDIIFKIQSLTLSLNSYNIIKSMINNQLTSARIQIEVTPIKHKYKDVASVLTLPSFYLFKMQNDHFMLINWSPEQSNTKNSRVIYSFLQSNISSVMFKFAIKLLKIRLKQYSTSHCLN
ncbi:hypothetical protein HWI79_2017 [Cryptosporidium felis]|nr:hypothetical protein HWI79_2017 [Cryptosporidium felis]